MVMLWLALSFWAFIGKNTTEPVAEENEVMQPDSRECPAPTLKFNTCFVAAESVKNKLERELPTTSREITELCNSVRYLVYECWNNTKYLSTCVPQSATLKRQTKWLAKNVCSESEFRKEYLHHAPCVWKWARGQSFCTEPYSRLLTHLKVEGEFKNMDYDFNSVCCAFREFAHCASRQTSYDCGHKAGVFVGKFLMKMAGEVVERQCNSNKKDLAAQCKAESASSLSDSSAFTPSYSVTHYLTLFLSCIYQWLIKI